MLVDGIVNELVDKDDDVNGNNCGVKRPNKLDDSPDAEEDEESSNEVLSPARVAAQPSLSVGNIEESGVKYSMTADPSQVPETQVNPSICITPREDGSVVGNLPRGTRAISCPPTANRHALSGPWSWEWLQDHSDGVAGVIFSATKRANRVDHQKGRTGPKKAGGVLRHPVHSLKKIARLPSKDRGEVLKALGKCVRRRRGGGQAISAEASTSGPTNNDWQNWVTVHGDNQMVVDDVREIGQSIGVTFVGDKENMFRVLSRAGKGKQENPGRWNRERARKEKSC
jgi:hypothetical protein